MGMREYRNNENYFLHYFLTNAFVFGVGAIVLFLLSYPTSFSHSLEHLFLIPVGAVFGLVVSTAFHNAAHHNIKPKLLNAIVGELTGAITLEGMRNFRVGHCLHHMHADDPALDPHPPAGLSFVKFLQTSRSRTIECLIRVYLDAHGDTKKSRRNIRYQLIVFHIALLLKIAFWFLLLKSTMFFWFFVPSYLAYFFGFAHLNYISHLPDPDGVVRITDHNRGAFFTVMNAITSGGYYHRSHHRKPWLYNPSKNENQSQTV
jgi:fatty-acid desaturase